MSEFEYLNGGNSEAQDKLATSYLLAQASVGLARTGVLSGLTVAQTTTASGSVLIVPGAGVVQASVLPGASLLVNDTTKTLDVFTANPMGGLPRNDVVVFDATTATITVIVGVPNATPDDPTVPATACALARLRHAASATTIPTAKIDSLIVNTALRGVMAPAVTVKRITNAGPFSTPVSAGFFAVPPVTGDGVKRFEITASFWVALCTVVGDVFDFFITDTSTGTVIKTQREYVTSALLSTHIGIPGMTIQAVDTPAAGSHIYNLTAVRMFGTGTGTIQASATEPLDLVIKQIA